MWAYGKFLKNGNLLNKKNKELELHLQKLKLFFLKDRGRKLYSTPLVMEKKLYQPYENLILACNPVTCRFLSWRTQFYLIFRKLATAFM